MVPIKRRKTKPISFKHGWQAPSSWRMSTSSIIGSNLTSSSTLLVSSWRGQSLRFALSASRFIRHMSHASRQTSARFGKLESQIQKISAKSAKWNFLTQRQRRLCISASTPTFRTSWVELTSSLKTHGSMCWNTPTSNGRLCKRSRSIRFKATKVVRQVLKKTRSTSRETLLHTSHVLQVTSQLFQSAWSSQTLKTRGVFSHSWAWNSRNHSLTSCMLSLLGKQGAANSTSCWKTWPSLTRRANSRRRKTCARTLSSREMKSRWRLMGKRSQSSTRGRRSRRCRISAILWQQSASILQVPWILVLQFLGKQWTLFKTRNRRKRLKTSWDL